VAPCSDADGGPIAVGAWENVTPPAVSLKGDGGLLGTLAVEVDPQDPARVYSTGDHQGLFRSDDCGAHWTKINTGKNGSTLDTGSEWVLRIDPANPSVMYSSPLYGSNPSLLKSTNGGVDWDDVMPMGSVVRAALQYMFFQDLSIEPTNTSHLVASLHVDCITPHRPVCLGESMDGGATWRIVEGPPSLTGWVEDAGPIVVSATTIFYGAPFAGLFRTDDGGATWSQVAPQGYHRFYSSSTGWTYMGSAQAGIYRSKDLSTWTVIPQTLTTVGGALIGDGQRIFAGARQYVKDQTSAESDGLMWTDFAGPPVMMGPTWYQYDSVHHILYSTNNNAGLWRMVTH
jgi:photosystem II stability/assembly factor-like uncharacterized protein